MTNVMKNEKGFTLLEIIVVLAVLGALAAMLSPVVFRYIDDANRARAQADVSTIAAAINKMYGDTGRLPFYADGAGSGTGALAWGGTDANTLTSNDACATAATDLTCDANRPSFAGVTGWADGDKANSLSNQLMENTPVYATSGNRQWRGPYLEAIPTTDPWTKSYLVNVKDADPADNDPDAVFVISAGPDGIIQTSAETDAQTNLVAGGDDIIARVK